MKPIYDIKKDFSSRIKKFFYVLAANAFLAILIFVLIELIFGCFIFYKYVFLAQTAEPPYIEDRILKFDKATYQKILDKLEPQENVSVP